VDAPQLGVEGAAVVDGGAQDGIAVDLAAHVGPRSRRSGGVAGGGGGRVVAVAGVGRDLERQDVGHGAVEGTDDGLGELREDAGLAEAAGRGRLLLSQHALNRIPKVTQALCTPVAESIGDEIELYSLPWGDERGLACKVWIEESGEQLPLPRQDIIAFGRLDALVDGTRANDIVLTHPDREAQLAISRWHFELRRTRRGHMLRRVSSQLTEVDGRPIEQGEEVQVRPGTTVRLAQVMTLRFLGRERACSSRDAVTLQKDTSPRGTVVTVRDATGDFEDTFAAGGADPVRAP
jgi:hypothetical protein